MTEIEEASAATTDIASSNKLVQGYNKDSGFSSLAAPYAALLGTDAVVDPGRINMIDAENILGNWGGFPASIQPLLRGIQKRRDVFPKRFYWKDYLEQNVLLAVSDYAKKRSMCLCGLKNHTGKYQSCKLWKLCSFCASQYQKDILGTYLGSFSRGTWSFLTISHRYSLKLVATPDAEKYWEATRQTLKDLYEEGFFNGIIAREEFAATDRFASAIVHLHLLVDARTFSREVGYEIADRILNRLDDWEKGIFGCPNIDCQAVPTLLDYFCCLEYLVKTMPIARWYAEALPIAEADGQHGICMLNQDVNHFLATLHMNIQNRRQVFCFGTCHWKHRSSLRTPKSKRHRIEALATEMRLEATQRRNESPLAAKFEDVHTVDRQWRCEPDRELLKE